MISLENLTIELRSKSSTRTIRTELLQVGEGKIGVLMGENGKGKTTVLRAATRSIVPISGRVNVDRPMIAFTDIERQVHHRLTLVENHMFFSGLYGLKKVSRERTKEYLDIAGLSQMYKKKAGSLSKGEKVRLVFSIVDAFSCASFIVDEPTNGLDNNGLDYIKNVIARKLYQGSAGLISSHDHKFVQAVEAIKFQNNADGVFVEKKQCVANNNADGLGLSKVSVQ